MKSLNIAVIALVVVCSSLHQASAAGLSFLNRIAFRKENPIDPTLQDVTFFQRIQSLNLGPEEITSSYRNLTAEVKTDLCEGMCKSTAALWLLQELSPCDNIVKADCPVGLLCCQLAVKTREQASSYRDRNKYPYTNSPSKPKHGSNPDTPDADLNFAEDTTRVSFVPYSNDGSGELYYPEPILDPIPNDETSHSSKV